MEYTIEAHHDVALADRLERAQGWLRGAREVQRRMDVHPEGWFRAVDQGGETIGTSTCFTFAALDGPHAGLAWIGGMVVLPHLQGRGIGKALFQRALDYAGSRRTSVVGLDATERGRPLYEKQGFEVVTRSSRWRRVANGPPKTPRAVAALYPASTCEALELYRFDAPRFGANRTPWLASVLADLPERCFVALDRPKGHIVGYVLGQEEFIGPLVADSPEVATQLLVAAELAGTPPRIHIMDNHREAISVMKELGYEPEGAAVTRMTKGGLMPGRPTTQYGAAAWALG